jgi:hypothetical protein
VLFSGVARALERLAFGAVCTSDVRTPNGSCRLCHCFFEFRICFGFRYSDFGFSLELPTDFGFTSNRSTSTPRLGYNVNLTPQDSLGPGSVRSASGFRLVRLPCCCPARNATANPVVNIAGGHRFSAYCGRPLVTRTCAPKTVPVDCVPLSCKISQPFWVGDIAQSAAGPANVEITRSTRPSLSRSPANSPREFKSFLKNGPARTGFDECSIPLYSRNTMWACP